MTMFRVQQNAFDDAVGESCGVLEDLWLIRRGPQVGSHGEVAARRDVIAGGCRSMLTLLLTS